MEVGPERISARAILSVHPKSVKKADGKIYTVKNLNKYYHTLFCVRTGFRQCFAYIANFPDHSFGSQLSSACVASNSE